MVSEKQLEANRRNAQLSTGPRTQAGKDKVRCNALTHGMRAEALDVLPNEDPELFAVRLAAWEFELKPIGEAQIYLARQAAIYSWKIERVDRYEAAVLSRDILDAIHECDCADDDSQALGEAAALASFDPSNAGERLRRYQFALQRALLRVLDTLAKLKREEAKHEAMGANEATSVKAGRPAVDGFGGVGRPAPSEEPAPNKPISTSSPAPNKPISTSSPAPNKPISPGRMQFSSGSVGKRSQPPKHEIWPIDLDLLSPDAGAKGWLNVSCLKS